MADKIENNTEKLDNPDETGDNRQQEQKPNPRDALIERMQQQHWDAEVEALRAGGIDSTIPIVAPAEEGETEVEVDAAAPKTVVAPAKTEPSAETIDPLKDLVVIQDGKPMLKTKVDGVERFLPLDKVQQSAQKLEAADSRLQQASETLRSVKVREDQVRLQEAALSVRTTQPSLPVITDADDKANVEKDAQRLAKALITGTEGEITGVLTEVLTKNRQASQPAIKVDELVKQTAAQVKKTMVVENQQQALATGFQKFQTDFPDIAKDPGLYKYADGLSEKVGDEHPNWTPEQIFAETGRLTREWVAGLTGKPVVPVVIPATPDTTSRRAQTKQTLRPMPSSRIERVATNEPTVEDTPASIISELRKARGQAA